MMEILKRESELMRKTTITFEDIRYKVQPGEGIEAERKDRENPKCDPVAHTNHLILYFSDMCAIFICFYIFLIFMQFIFDLGLRIESILSMTQ